MKIPDVTTYIVGNPWKNWVFTRINTDAGDHGIGEAPFDVENHTLKLLREVYSDGG